MSIEDKTKLKIAFNDKMILFNITQCSIPQKDYEVILSMEQLYKINKYFINFETSKELVECLINSLKQKNSNIKFEENKCYIEILNPITNKLFNLSLNKKEKDINSRVSYLESIIIQQKNEILNLKDKIIQFEPMFEEYKRKEEEKNFFSNSDILDFEEKKMLINWLPNRPKKLTLLLNSNKDGDSTKTFIDKCQGKCPTYVIIETSKGYKFGGYTNQFWKESQAKDNEAFVFSLNNKKKYSIVKPDYAIGFRLNNWWGFGFSYNAIVVYENCTSNNNNYVGNETYNIKEKYELNGGEYNFTVKSFEIYHIEY